LISTKSPQETHHESISDTYNLVIGRRFKESTMSKKIFVRAAAELSWAVPAAFVMALCCYQNPGLASPLVLLVVGLRMKVETSRLRKNSAA
jgi:hypothetical protein